MSKAITSEVTTAHESDPAPAAGQAARYLLQEEVGRGGMGIVYRAADPQLGRTLAVKVLAATGPDAEQRFLEEARLTARLQHPGVPPVHEAGALPDGRPFFAMKLVEGRDLAALLADRATPAEELPRWLGVFATVCQTLAFAHSRGIVHRDLKPANVMVGAFGEVQVMDWGLAKERSSPALRPAEGEPIASGDDTQTQPGRIAGTPAYLAPEQARGEQLDTRADVFGLGGILCVILTGRPPFGGDPASAVATSARGDVAEALARLDGCGADPELIALAQRCLAPNRDERPANGAAVAAAVAAHLAGVQERLQRAEQERARAEVREAEARKRRRLALALAAVVLLAVAAGVGVWMWLAVQRAGAARDVAAALGRSAVLLEEGKLPEALAAARQAEGLLDAAGRPADLAAQVAASVADAELAQELEAIRFPGLSPGEGGTRADVSRRFQTLFRAADLDPDTLSPDEIARRLDARPAVRGRLVVALDEWLSARKRMYQDRAAQRRLAAAASAADPDPWRRRLREALVRDDLPALQELARAAPVGEQTPSALGLLALGLFSAGEREAALSLCRQAQWAHPDDFWLRWFPCRWRYLTGLHATELAEQVSDATVQAALRPQTGWVWGQLAETLEQAGRLDDAARAGEKALQIEGPGSLGGLYLARVRRRQGRPADAADIARRGIDALRRLGSSATGIDHEVLAMYQEWLGDYAGALASHRRALELQPDEPLVHGNLGYVLKRVGRLAEALPHLRYAVELAPWLATAQSNLLDTLVSLDRTEEAVALARRWLAKDPGTPLYADLSSALEQLGRLDEAVQATRDGIRRSRTDSHAPEMLHNNLANLLNVQGGSLDEADTAIHEALRINPRSVIATLTLAEVRQAQGRFAESLDAYRKGHELAQAERETKWPTADWVKDAERLVELDRRLPAVLEEREKPKGASGRLAFARVCVFKGRHGDALRFFRAAFKLEAKAEPAHRYQAARCAVLLAATDDAQAPALRAAALRWLRAELESDRKRLATGKPADRRIALAALNHRRTHDDLLSVRDSRHLAALPSGERAAWQAFWRDAEAARTSVAK